MNIQTNLFDIQPIFADHIEVKKPKLTMYSDYLIQDGKCYAIFETKDGRRHTPFVCNTTKTLDSWKEFSIEETETSLFIKL